jgi:hypothetical protein
MLDYLFKLRNLLVSDIRSILTFCITSLLKYFKLSLFLRHYLGIAKDIDLILDKPSRYDKSTTVNFQQF